MGIISDPEIICCSGKIKNSNNFSNEKKLRSKTVKNTPKKNQNDALC
jgi:hypothetical protein